MPSKAQPPSAYVTAVPGRYAPTFVTLKNNPANETGDSSTTSRQKFLPRSESVGADFQTPTQQVTELGTAWNVGEYDSLPDSKLTISSYDVGCNNLSLLANKHILNSGETDFTYSDLASASNDIVITYADPNGNIFYSEFYPDLLIDSYGISLKQKAAAMESYEMVGPAQLGFRGFFVTKGYVVQSADATANGFTIASIMGASETPVPVPIPQTGQPANYWVQRGCINYIKINRWRSGVGWLLYTEVVSASPSVTGTCHGTTAGVFTFPAGDLVAGDLFHITYATYGTNVVGYTTIPTGTLDTSDPIAIDTRLTPISINGTQVGQGQGLDIKMSLKRDRVEGIGDVSAIYAPPAQPDASISLDMTFRGGNIDTLIRTGLPYGSDGPDGFSAGSHGGDPGDFIDANYDTRLMLNTPCPIGATIYDPRNAGFVVKQIVAPQAVFKQRSLSMATKNNVTLKYTGSDQIGNIGIGTNQGAACSFPGLV